jgi:hypothetical protein
MRSASLGLPPASYQDTARRPETGPVPPGYAAALTLAAMSLGYGVVQLDITIVNTAITAIGTSLGGGAMSSGLGLLVPPLTSTLLGSVEKSRSASAAGVLNATRQTGSVLGVALFGSLVSRSGTFMAGLHASLTIAAGVLTAAAVAIWFGRRQAPKATTRKR